MTWNFEQHCFGCSERDRQIAALQRELEEAQRRANTAIIENRRLESRLLVAEPEHRQRRR